MKALSMMTACLAVVAGSAFAMDDMKKDGMAKDPMTMQKCKDHMAMVKPGMKKDDVIMKKDTLCADMKKKDGGMVSAPMTK